MDDGGVVDHCLSEGESNGEEEDEGRHGSDAITVNVFHALGYRVPLENKRQVDGDDHRKREDRRKDTNGICASRHSAVIVREMDVKFHPRTEEVQSGEESAKEAEEEGEDVKNVDWSSALGCLREQKDDEEHDPTPTGLCSIVDRAGIVVPVFSVNSCEGDIDQWEAMIYQQVDHLVVVVKGCIALADTRIGIGDGPRSQDRLRGCGGHCRCSMALQGIELVEES